MSAFYQVHIKRETSDVDGEPNGLSAWQQLPTGRVPRTEVEALDQADELRKAYVHVRVVRYTTVEEVIYQ